MGIQRTAVTAAALAVAVGVLAGCGSPSPAPQPATQEEIDAARESEARTWWNSIFPDDPMPEVAVIQELPLDEAIARQNECMGEAGIPAVLEVDPGDGRVEGDVIRLTDQELQGQWWACAQRYPIAGSYDWVLSSSEIEWLYSFFSERHIPCLRTAGLNVHGFPPIELFLGSESGYPVWLPYEHNLTPVLTRPQWDRVAQRCPLPEMLESYGLPGYHNEP